VSRGGDAGEAGRYRISLLRAAQKDLDKLPVRERERTTAAIRALADDPRPPGCAKLRGRADWRIRSGDYRVIYSVDDPGKSVQVLAVAHRREAYRR
jgi:mRNA interferase RelE/StbE